MKNGKNSKNLLLFLSLFFLSNAFASGKGEVMMLDKEDSNSTRSQSYHDYNHLSFEDKYNENIRNFSKDRMLSLSNMSALGEEDKYLPAQLFMGEYYRLSKYNKENIEKAIYWYKKASEQHSDVAFNNLGIIFHAEGDYDEAKKYYSQACEYGYDASKRNLEKLEEDFQLY